MSLARTLMNGGIVGTLESNINPSRYGHEQGATVIAMESVEELHEIFLESYNYEQADLAAATEGVALEGSQYEAVAEASMKGMFTKIKEFFIKLRDKVKAFLHEVRKYLDAVFMSGKDFAKKYEKEIDKMDNIKDFSYKMFTYDDAAIDSVDKYADPKDAADEMTSVLDDVFAQAEKLDKNSDLGDAGLEDIDRLIKEIKDTSEDDRIVQTVTYGKCKSADDFDEYAFGKFRKGATGPDDKEDKDLSGSDVKSMAKTLVDSKALSRFDSVQSSSDKLYATAIKKVDAAEKKFSNAKGQVASKSAEALRLYSSGVSKLQSYDNRMINAWKAAVKERDSVYKSVIMAAFANNRKNSK